MTPDEITENLKTNSQGKILCSISNITYALENDEILEGAVAINDLTERVDIIKPLPWHRNGSMLDDMDLNYITQRLEDLYGFSNDKKIRKAVGIVANNNHYHPIIDFLEGLKWDGVPRINDCLYHFFGCERTELINKMFLITLMGMFSRVYHPGCKFDTMLILVGAQGMGKSTFFSFLAHCDDYFTDDIDRIEDEKIFCKLLGHWICEMPEMKATTSAKYVESIRAFLTRRSDTYRTPYETYPKDRKRQCIFVGSSNKIDCLPNDKTGNRRFFPILCDPSKNEVRILDDEAASRAYIDQVLAEAMVIYKSGNYPICLSKEDEAEFVEYQRQFTKEDTDEGIIISWIQNYCGDKICTKMISELALNKSSDSKGQDRSDILLIVDKAIASGLLPGWRKYEGTKRFDKYGPQRGWEKIKEPKPEPLPTLVYQSGKCIVDRRNE